jgi:hypothetical protein
MDNLRVHWSGVAKSDWRRIKFVNRVFALTLTISHYYSTASLKAKLLNLIAKGKIARETQATLNAAKAAIEVARS